MPQIRSKQVLGETPVNPNDLTTKDYVDTQIQTVKKISIEENDQLVTDDITTLNIVGADIEVSDGKVNINIPIPEYIIKFGTVEGLLQEVTDLRKAVMEMSTNQITVEDENNVVSTNISTINFIGADVKALSENGKVNVYIPTPQYVDKFNTSSTIISEYPTTLRYISKPVIEGNPFKIGDWVSGELHSSVNTSQLPLVYTTPTSFSIINQNTVFNVKVLDADNTTLLRDVDFTLTGDALLSSDGVSVVVSNWQPNYDRFMASVRVEIYLNEIITNGGRVSVILTHDNGGDVNTFTQSDIFYDTDAIIPTITGEIGVHINTPVVKTISGVSFYTLNTTFDVIIDGIDNTNNISFPATEQLSVDASKMFNGDILKVNGNGGVYRTFDVGTWSDAYDKTGSSVTLTELMINIQNSTNWNGTLTPASVSASLYDWGIVSTSTSLGELFIIDTLIDDSTRHSERFRSENQLGYERLTSTFDIWDSTESLLTFDGGTGLQIIGDRLVYPQFDFTSFMPINQPNYYGVNGDKMYMRKFSTDGNDVTNGVINLIDHNITENDITSGNVKIELCVDKSTWVDFAKQFDIDYTGCRAYVSQYNLTLNNRIYFTLNNLVEYYSKEIYIRITFTNTAKDKYIGGLDVIGTYWI